MSLKSSLFPFPQCLGSGPSLSLFFLFFFFLFLMRTVNALGQRRKCVATESQREFASPRAELQKSTGFRSSSEQDGGMRGFKWKKKEGQKDEEVRDDIDTRMERNIGRWGRRGRGRSARHVIRHMMEKKRDNQTKRAAAGHERSFSQLPVYGEPKIYC